MKRHKVAQHRTGLVKWTITIILAHAVLLQEIVFKHPRHLKRDLVRLAQRALADELYDLGEVFFLL